MHFISSIIFIFVVKILVYFLFLFVGKKCTKSSLKLTPNAIVRNDKQSYDFHEEVNMSCDHGYSGRTVTTRCTDANTWSATSPDCTSKFFSSILLKPARVVGRSILWYDTPINYCKIQNNKMPRWYIMFW